MPQPGTSRIKNILVSLATPKSGSGKSTLVKFIVAELGVPEEQVCYCAYTGKAVQVLKSKGCDNAITGHRLLYKSRRRANGTFYHIPKPSLYPYKVIIVDEVSMFPEHMWKLLLSHNVYVIALGDPFQLPAIGDSCDVLDSPHVFLDEIMRQAQESEIIRLSMDIRNKKPLKKFKGKEINIVDSSDVVSGMYTWADQILCGKNQTRKNINSFYRKMIWGDNFDPDMPLPQDKMICLKNNWDIINEAGDALVNGMTGSISNITLRSIHQLGKVIHADFLPDSYDDYPSNFIDIDIDYKFLNKGESSINQKNYRLFKDFYLEQFDYGYAVTTHKAQGSEYSKVLLFEEVLRRDMHERWLYTGVTRSKDKITIVRNR